MRHITSRALPLAAISVLSLGLALGACSSDSSSKSTEATTPPTESAPSVTDAPVTVPDTAVPDTEVPDTEAGDNTVLGTDPAVVDGSPASIGEALGLTTFDDSQIECLGNKLITIFGPDQAAALAATGFDDSMTADEAEGVGVALEACATREQAIDEFSYLFEADFVSDTQLVCMMDGLYDDIGAGGLRQLEQASEPTEEQLATVLAQATTCGIDTSQIPGG